MNDQTTHQMIDEMEVAYAVVVQKNRDAPREREAAVTRALHKYLSPGMQVDEALMYLKQLSEHGFRIIEARYEGTRVWPDGEFRPHFGNRDQSMHRKRYVTGVSEFSALKQVGAGLLIVARHIAIRFRVIDGSGVISDIEGKVWVGGI